jgi:hypothetical protein
LSGTRFHRWETDVDFKRKKDNELFERRVTNWYNRSYGVDFGQTNKLL